MSLLFAIVLCVLSATLGAVCVVIVLRQTRPDLSLGMEIARNWIAAYNEGRQVGMQQARDSNSQSDIPLPHSIGTEDEWVEAEPTPDPSDVSIGRNYGD